ncbi:NAD-dependent epimerase/dehydratase family protein [Algoriphagus hitonicola]|uniref:Nucleoside-diphosphate-sugar epimerase n=1 Tax=Algoriphagus hitonicola TaxID=435880 RepID=A0A1I2X3K5_9BACT|nr:NAD-dependent epimerase/dehydratase family protein [Algoriphagus hitonicola]SFH08100.1 Nucleoside-diphosphate-sugar epimerase [Algoriphagus hitonicola]
MKVLLSGGTGFFGGFIHRAFQDAGHQIQTIGRSKINDISCDLSLESPELPAYDLIIHAAGKAHMIPKMADEEQEFSDVNFQGTVNLVKGLVHRPKTFIFISTVAVYGLDTGLEIDESSPLNGDSPYAKSKIAAEKFLQCWAKENNIDLYIFRLPLIFGEDAPGNLGKMENAIKKGYYIRIGNSDAEKSVVSAQDAAVFFTNLKGIPGVYNLVSKPNPKLSEIEEYYAKKYSKKIFSIPLGFFSILAKLGDLFPMFPLNTYSLDKLTKSLTFSSKKANSDLNWNTDGSNFLNNVN